MGLIITLVVIGILLWGAYDAGKPRTFSEAENLRRPEVRILILGWKILMWGLLAFIVIAVLAAGS